jgi:peptidase E
MTQSDIAITNLGDSITIIQQQQDYQGLHMGYLRRLNLSNDAVKVMLEWCKENKKDLCYEVFFKDLPNFDIKSCDKCAAANWDGG